MQETTLQGHVNELLAKMYAAAEVNAAHALLWSGDEWTEDILLGMECIMSRMEVAWNTPFKLSGHEFILRRFTERNEGRGGSVVMESTDAAFQHPAKDPHALWVQGLAKRGIELKTPPPYKPDSNQPTFYIDAN